MSIDGGHPPGECLWRFTLVADEDRFLDRAGHTANDALRKVGAELGWPRWPDVQCEPIPGPVQQGQALAAPAPPVKARGRARRLEARP